MKLNSTAFINSTVGVVWAIVALTLASELSESFKAFLTGLASHHWVAKSLISLGLFALLYVLYANSKESDPLKGVYRVVGSVVLGGLIIFAFFIWAYLRG